MKKATRNLIGHQTLEPLEQRQLMSSVQLVDGMLILQGNAHGHNRLSVTPDRNGTTLFAHAGNAKGHYLLSEIQSIRIIGGEKADVVYVDPRITKNTYVRTGAGNDRVSTGAGSDTVIGGNGADTLIGNGGDDLLIGGGGADKIDAGAGDDPNAIWPHKNSAFPTAVTLVLMDADTGKAIGQLGNGAVVNLAKLPTRLNIVADLSDGSAGSVRFIYDADSSGHIENAAPYALAADNHGKLNSWNPKIGIHTLAVTPYSQANTHGTSGTDEVITFTVTNDPNATGPALLTGSTTTPPTQTNNPPPTPVTQPPPTTPVTQPPPPTPQGNDDAKAPVAKISVLDSSVTAGNSIYVNALQTTLKTGSMTDASFSWNFGDPGSAYNTLNGFNAAHAYTQAGTYTITLTATDAAGKTDSATTQVTITAAGRNYIYVSPTGNDTNSGTSPSAAVKTFARAADLVGDNTELLFQRGGTYNVSSAMNIGFSNVAVGAYGSGNLPVLKYTSGANYGAIFTTLGGKDVLIHDLAFDSTNTSLGDTGYNAGINAGGTDITIRDCSFVNVGYAINTNAQPDGVLVQDNVCPNSNSVRMYFAWVQGADQAYLGNSCKDSLNGHDLRVGGCDRLNLSYNNFTNLTSTGGLRGAMTIHQGTYVYVGYNTLNEGALGLGPLDAGAGLEDKGARLEYVVIENNMLNTFIHLGHGTDHVDIRDNVLNDDNNAAIQVPGWSDQYDRGTSDVTITHNTGINNAANGKFLEVGGAVSGFTVTDNLYVAPNFATGNYQSAPIQIKNKDLTGFTLIADNVWPSPTILSSANGGINYVGDSGTNDGYKTPTDWENYAQVKDDQFKDVTLTSNYELSVNGQLVGADMKMAA